METYLPESIEKARLSNAESDFNGYPSPKQIPKVLLPPSTSMTDLLRQKFALFALTTAYEIQLPAGEFFTVFSQRPKNSSLIHSITHRSKNWYIVEVSACANLDKVRTELIEFYQPSK